MTLARLVLAIRLKSINFGNQEIEILIVTVPVFWLAKLLTKIIVLENRDRVRLGTFNSILPIFHYSHRATAQSSTYHLVNQQIIC